MKTSGCRDRTLKNQHTRWDWHHNTFIPSLHLANYALCCVHNGLWKAEGWVVLSACCVDGEWVMLWVAAMKFLMSMADMICLECRNCGVHGWVCMVCCEILLLWNMAGMDCLLCRRLCGVSSAEYSVHLVGVNSLSACRELCGVHRWQNGTRCRDNVNLWYHSNLVW